MSTAFLIDQLEDDTQKSTVPFYDSSKPSLGDDHYDFQNGTDEDGNPLYVCGGMTSAYYWFQEINPNTGEPYYTNHIKVLHEKEGDLTIGIHCESTHDWVIWDNFTLTYVGQDNNVIADQLLKSLEELEEAASDDRSFLTAKANELTETLPEEAQKAISDNDADAMLTKIKEVNEAIQYIQEGHDLLEELLNTVAIYNESINNFDGLTPTDDSYADLLAKWDIDGGGKGRPSELADNQALHDLINQLKNGWVPYVMSAATNATQENPVNVTPVIVQPTYMDPLTGEFNENGWTSTIGTPGWDNYPEIEFYDKNFDHRQTIQNLPQGWYRVTINGFYRAGFADAAAKAYVADTMAYNAVMFAIGIDSVATHLTDIFADAQEVPFHGSDEVTVTLADDNSWYVPNRMASAYTYFDAGMYQNEVWAQVGEDGQLTIGVSKNQYISGDWTIFTNWNLWYAGKEPFDPTTGIHEMVNGQMVNGKWSNGKCYNLAGQQLSAKRTIDLSPSTHDLKKGIYLINGRKMVVK